MKIKLLKDVPYEGTFGEDYVLKKDQIIEINKIDDDGDFYLLLGDEELWLKPDVDAILIEDNEKQSNCFKSKLRKLAYEDFNDNPVSKKEIYDSLKELEQSISTEAFIASNILDRLKNILTEEEVQYFEKFVYNKLQQIDSFDFDNFRNKVIPNEEMPSEYNNLSPNGPFSK
ncbi:MAG: hypothetical protein ACOCP8_06890 [archaeon]